jgi:anaphase-promoting complex subunit 11
MKVTIKEWNAVAAWRWDMPDDDVCGICRNPYDSTCSKCKFPGDDCPLCMLFGAHAISYTRILTLGSARRMQSLFPHGMAWHGDSALWDASLVLTRHSIASSRG